VYSSPLSRAVRTAQLVLEKQGSTLPPAPSRSREGEQDGDARSSSREGERSAAAQLRIETHPALAEIDHGEWSGLTKAQVAQRWPELAEQWRTHPAGVRMPNGESLLEVRDRALNFLASLRQRHADGDVLIVTHGTVLRLLLAHFIELRPDRIWSVEAENCALSIVADHELPLIMAINDTCHLEQVRSSLQAQVR